MSTAHEFAKHKPKTARKLYREALRMALARRFVVGRFIDVPRGVSMTLYEKNPKMRVTLHKYGNRLYKARLFTGQHWVPLVMAERTTAAAAVRALSRKMDALTFALCEVTDGSNAPLGAPR